MIINNMDEKVTANQLAKESISKIFTHWDFDLMDTLSESTKDALTEREKLIVMMALKKQANRIVKLLNK